MTVRLRLKARPLTQWDIGRELRRRIKKTFDAQGIQLLGAARHDHPDPGSARAGHRSAGADPRADRRQHDALTPTRGRRRGFPIQSRPMDTSSPGAGPRIAGFIVGGIGLVLGGAGFVVWHFVPGMVAAEHARLEALPSPDAVSLTDTPAGREVIVEGRIAPDQPVLFRDFVAYVKEEEQRDKRERERTGNWKVVETVTPPLRLIVGGDGSVRVVNANYGLCSAKTQWTDQAQIIDTHYTGLVAGEAVVRPRHHGRRRPRGDHGRLRHPRVLPRRGRRQHRRRLVARRRLHGPRDADGRHRRWCCSSRLSRTARSPAARAVAAGTTGSSMKLAVAPAPIDALRRLHVVRRLGEEDVRHEGLRVAVVEREPARLDLHHDRGGRAGRRGWRSAGRSGSAAACSPGSPSASRSSRGSGRGRCPSRPPADSRPSPAGSAPRRDRRRSASPPSRCRCRWSRRRGWRPAAPLMRSGSVSTGV